MRETATLTRSVPRSGTWQDAPTNNFLQVFRPALLIVVLFIVGLGFGWTVTRFVASPPRQQITAIEYAAVVAQLYQRDHNLALAQERLALYGSPTDLVAQAVQASQSGQLRSPADRAALEALSQALGSPEGPQPSPQATATDGGGSAATISHDSALHPSWLGPFLAFLAAFTLGAIVLMRTAGLSLVLARLPGLHLTNFNLATRAPRRETRPPSAERGGSGRSPQATRATGIGLTDEERAPDRLTSAPVATRPPSRSVGFGSNRGNVAAVRNRRVPIFQSSYRIGDDPFDEIHPITDPTTGSLIAACGLSAALKLDSLHTARYFAFTAWLQDYVDHEELHAAGLVAPGAFDRSRAQIEGWVRGGQIDNVLPIEKGAMIPIGSNDLTATVTIVNVEYGHEAAQPDSYVTQLTVRFEIQDGEATGGTD